MDEKERTGIAGKVPHSQASDERIESYLVEVVGRLMDTQTALESIQRTASFIKQKMLEEGKNFVYQQAMIDIATELYRYATGEDNLQEIIERIAREQQNVKKRMQGGGSMEVV